MARTPRCAAVRSSGTSERIRPGFETTSSAGWWRSNSAPPPGARRSDRSTRSAFPGAPSTAQSPDASSFFARDPAHRALRERFGAANLHRLGDARIEIARLHQRHCRRASRPAGRCGGSSSSVMRGCANSPTNAASLTSGDASTTLQRPDPRRARATGFPCAGCCPRRRRAAPTPARCASGASVMMERERQRHQAVFFVGQVLDAAAHARSSRSADRR